MSRETITWLNENTMVGGTADRLIHAKNNWMILDPTTGNYKPWWQAEGFKYAYEGFIPQEDVETHLFNWEPLETAVWNRVECAADVADAVDGRGVPFRWVPDTVRKGIVHPRTDHVFGYFGKETYQVHSSKEWLINDVYRLLDADASDCGILTAGQLRNGGVSYVSIAAPEGIVVEGFSIRPLMVSGTSIDGTLATTRKFSDYAPVCDNSFNAIMESAAAALKIKHTSKSSGNLHVQRAKLGIQLGEHGTKLEQFLRGMMDIDVTDSEFARIITAKVPTVVPEVKDGRVTNQRAVTIAEGKQSELLKLWKSDPRVAKWTGTLFGAFQAANTWDQHFRSNNENVVERSMTGVLGGQFAKNDREFWTIVNTIETISTKKIAELVSA